MYVPGVWKYICIYKNVYILYSLSLHPTKKNKCANYGGGGVAVISY